MDPTLLTERGWKAALAKFKLKDNGLQRALATSEKLDEKDHDERIKAMNSVCQLALTLKKSKEVAAIPPAVKHLTDMVTAGQAEQREILKAKVIAAKTAKVAALAQEKDEKEEEEQGDYVARLNSVFQKLKSSKGLSYPFIVCEGRPFWGVAVAKQITPKHKTELLKVVAGAGKRFFPGECKFDDGKFAFTMERPMSGLARKLQDSIKYFTGKKLPLIVGTESAEADDT
jgi:hypothetical protein